MSLYIFRSTNKIFFKTYVYINLSQKMYYFTVCYLKRFEIRFLSKLNIQMNKDVVNSKHRWFPQEGCVEKVKLWMKPSCFFCWGEIDIPLALKISSKANRPASYFLRRQWSSRCLPLSTYLSLSAFVIVVALWWSFTAILFLSSKVYHFKKKVLSFLTPPYTTTRPAAVDRRFFCLRIFFSIQNTKTQKKHTCIIYWLIEILF